MLDVEDAAWCVIRASRLRALGLTVEDEGREIAEDQRGGRAACGGGQASREDTECAVRLDSPRQIHTKMLWLHSLPHHNAFVTHVVL